MSFPTRLAIGLVLALIAQPLLAAEIPLPLRHDLQVKLDPTEKRLQVRDIITLPVPTAELTVDLHAGLSPVFHSDHGAVFSTRVPADSYRERFRLKLPKNSRVLRIEYGGVIHHALSSSRAEQSRGFRRSAGLIDAEGVFLAAGSLWYPQVDGYHYLAYSLDVEMPAGWSSVSQGTRQLHEHDDPGLLHERRSVRRRQLLHHRRLRRQLLHEHADPGLLRERRRLRRFEPLHD